MKNNNQSSRSDNEIDSSTVENMAELLVASKLLQVNIIPAKPMVDKNGGDLICLLRIDENFRFGRIQVKGRSLLGPDSSSHFEIPKSYVTGTFFAFLYLRLSESVEAHNPLYCFFVEDIMEWTLNTKNEYQISFSYKNYENKFRNFFLTNDKVNIIKNQLSKSNSETENSLLMNTFYSPSRMGKYYDLSDTITSGRAVMVPGIK